MGVDIHLIGKNYTTGELKYVALDPSTHAVLVKEIGLDHGELSGLADDDHIQYLLINGSRAMTGPLTLSGAPTVNLHAATKKYVDDAGVTDHGELAGLGDDDHVQYYNQARGDARYLRLAGGVMTGLLTLSGAPTIDLHAATKKYVDDNIGAGNLSELTIDAHKDWNAKNITNMGTIEHKGATLKSGIQTEGRCTAYNLDPNTNFASGKDTCTQGVFREKLTNTPSSVTLSNATETLNEHVSSTQANYLSKYGFQFRVITSGGATYYGSTSKKYVTVGN